MSWAGLLVWTTDCSYPVASPYSLTNASHVRWLLFNSGGYIFWILPLFCGQKCDFSGRGPRMRQIAWPHALQHSIKNSRRGRIRLVVFKRLMMTHIIFSGSSIQSIWMSCASKGLLSVRPERRFTGSFLAQNIDFLACIAKRYSVRSRVRKKKRTTGCEKSSLCWIIFARKNFMVSGFLRSEVQLQEDIQTRNFPRILLFQGMGRGRSGLHMLHATRFVSCPF